MRTVDVSPSQTVTPAKTYIRVRVRSPVGKTLDYEVCPEETVADLKRRMEAREGTDAKGQRLLCNGVLMINSRSLGSYNLREHSVLLSLPQLKSSEKAGRDKAGGVYGHSARRGFLLIPGMDDPWRPHTTSKITKQEADWHFDSTTVQAPWRVRPTTV